jgi:signal transduction histidine kinase
VTVTPTRWSLRTRITLLCGVTAIVLAVLAAGAAGVAANNRNNLDDVFDRIGPLRTASEQYLTAVVDQDTGIRGYAVHGTDADLAPYTDGMRQQAQLAATMRSGLAGRPDELAKLAAVEDDVAGWRVAVATPVVDRVKAGDLPGAQALIDADARDRFDRIRAGITALQADITAIRDAAVKRTTDGSDAEVVLLAIAAAVVVLAGILLTLLLTTLVTRPVRRLADEVRRVADGDFAHVVDTRGPPEVAALSHGVDEMRRQILKDLETVRGARLAVEQANQRLEEQAEELTRSNRDLEQFAYVASHDLQEPLRKVASFCQLLQRRYAGQLDERADQYIGFAVDGAQRMQRLINDLLAFSRIGRLNAEFTDVDLASVAADVAAEQGPRLAQAGGELTIDELPTVRGEEALLAALLANLIGNSVKFRQPDVPPRVRLSAREVDGEWEITCQDNGIGIQPEYADKVFVIFQRLHTRSAYPGTGIGLAISKKIVEYHGGRIWLDSDAPGPGTTIRFTLPRTPVAAPEPVTPMEKEAVG